MYDLCKIIESVESHKDHRRLFASARRTSGSPSAIRGQYTFGEEQFTVGRELGGGEYGRVLTGTFGTRDVVVKQNVNVTMREDVNETIMQTRVYCYVRDLHRDMRDVARIPEAVFTASIPGFGRVLGMEQVDAPLLKHVQQIKTSTAQIKWLRDALAKVCRLLVLLQDGLSFVHGDLHGENVMVRGGDVFLIDFGMASACFGGHTRMLTSERYKGVNFHPHLDLLTLFTSLREDLALSKHERTAAWCGAFVDPFWKTVHAGLVSESRGTLPYGAQRTVRTAHDEISSNGEVYYAHHLLYEAIGRVSFPPCAPGRMLRQLVAAATSPPRALTQTRIFEDV